MNQVIKQLWLTALESGEYKQGQYALAKDNDKGETRYCCLGVLCNIAANQGICNKVKDEDDDIIKYSYDGELGTLPDSVRTWAELPFRENADSEDDSQSEDEDILDLIIINDDSNNFDKVIEIIKEIF